MADASDTDHDLLLRIDERVRQAVTTMEQRDIYHRGEMDRLSSLFRDTVASFTTTIVAMQTNFVTRLEMVNHHETLKAEQGSKHDALKGSVGRLERIVYGACGVILLGVIGALMALVLKGQHL